MVEIAVWLLIGLCFVGAFAALIFPILPGIPFLWAGFLLYHFIIADNELTMSFWVLQVAVTLLLLVVDFLANRYFIGEKTDSKWTERVGCLAIIVGSFIIPPIGLILVPFISVFVIEKMQKKSWREASMTAFATVIAFLSSVIAKGIIQVVMIVFFLLYLYF